MRLNFLPELIDGAGGIENAPQHEDLQQADQDHGNQLGTGPIVDQREIRFGQLAIPGLVGAQEHLDLSGSLQIQRDVFDVIIHECVCAIVLIFHSHIFDQFLRVELILIVGRHLQREGDNLAIEGADRIVETEIIYARLVGDQWVLPLALLVIADQNLAMWIHQHEINMCLRLATVYDLVFDAEVL